MEWLRRRIKEHEEKDWKKQMEELYESIKTLRLRVEKMNERLERRTIYQDKRVRIVETGTWEEKVMVYRSGRWEEAGRWRVGEMIIYGDIRLPDCFGYGMKGGKITIESDE